VKANLTRRGFVKRCPNYSHVWHAGRPAAMRVGGDAVSVMNFRLPKDRDVALHSKGRLDIRYTFLRAPGWVPTEITLMRDLR
jgi:hypothetical protein